MAQCCVYGVDLNPLAVELAKLSLWLTTVANDRPLSFLDHHLRPGNSLVGAHIERLQFDAVAAKKNRGRLATEKTEAASRISLFADSAFTRKMSTAVSSMWLIEENAALSAEDVKVQERLYGELRTQLVGEYVRLLSLVTAAQFGVEVDDALAGTGEIYY